MSLWDGVIFADRRNVVLDVASRGFFLLIFRTASEGDEMVDTRRVGMLL
jgi:hypothetical protein